MKFISRNIVVVAAIMQYRNVSFYREIKIAIQNDFPSFIFPDAQLDFEVSHSTFV